MTKLERGLTSYSTKPEHSCKQCNFKTNYLDYLMNVHIPKQHGIKRGFKNQLEVLP